MDEQEQIFWEMINFELGETLEYLKDKESVWQHLSDENKALIIQLVSGRSELFTCKNCGGHEKVFRKSSGKWSCADCAFICK